MNNRKIVLDTETTGLNYLIDDRIIEIAAVELINDSVLGKEFHYYINPEREVPEESTKIHGITNEDLIDKPKFIEIIEEFEDFIGDSVIIAHNAEFDRNFINLELGKLNKSIIPKSRCICTLQIARSIFKGEKVSLDELCNKFNIDKTSRKDHHGALIDVKLLSQVYYNLISLNSSLIEDDILSFTNDLNQKISYKKQNFEYRNYPLDQKIINQHKEFLKKIKNPLWED